MRNVTAAHKCVSTIGITPTGAEMFVARQKLVMGAVALIGFASTIEASPAHAALDITRVVNAGTPALDAEIEIPQPADLGTVLDAPCQIPSLEGQVTTCVQPAATTQEAREDVARRAANDSAADGDFAVQAVQPIPQWCLDNAFGGIYITRTQICEIFGVEYTITEVQNGVPVVTGTISANVYSYEYMSDSLETVAHQFEHSAYRITGSAVGTTIDAYGTCNGWCTTDSSTFPTQPVTLDTYAQGEAYFTTTVLSPGGMGSLLTKWNFGYQTPGFPPSNRVETNEFPARCDNATPGRSNVGCVVPDYIPIQAFSRSGAYPEFAYHVSQAQASGLRGGSRANPLTRTTDAARVAANAAAACPNSPLLPRPPGRSCDEYPFRSTYEGAASGGTARSFPLCLTADPPGSGPVGFSRCMIDSSQNSGAGGVLGGFYSSNRVIDGDKFAVIITS